MKFFPNTHQSSLMYPLTLLAHITFFIQSTLSPFSQGDVIFDCISGGGFLSGFQKAISKYILTNWKTPGFSPWFLLFFNDHIISIHIYVCDFQSVHMIY